MQPPSEEKEQGQVQVDEALEKQTAEAAPMESAAPPVPAAPTAQGPDSVTFKNPFMLLPPQVLYRNMGGQAKTPVQTNQDMSLFWDILASDQQVDPTVRLIADALKPKR